MLHESGCGLYVLNLLTQLIVFQCTYCVMCDSLLFIESAKCLSRVLLNHVQSFTTYQNSFFVYIVFSFVQVCFIYLQCSNSLWQPPHAGKLLSVLKHMPQKYGPDAFFNFPGKSAAVCRYFKFLFVCYSITAIGYFHLQCSFVSSTIVIDIEFQQNFFL